MRGRIWVDGSGVLKEGQMGRIAIVFDDGRQIVTEVGRVTNNEAEYLALLGALEDEDCLEDTIYTDSQLLVGHLLKGWRVKAENLIPLWRQAKVLLAEKRCRLEWVSREENRAGRLLET